MLRWRAKPDSEEMQSAGPFVQFLCAPGIVMFESYESLGEGGD